MNTKDVKCVIDAHVVVVDVESRDDEQDESAFGNAKPMLPYSSMFVLGSTNPLVDCFSLRQSTFKAFKS